MRGITVNLTVPVSELYDKFTILQIKQERIKDAAKRQAIDDQFVIAKFKCSEVQSMFDGHTANRLRELVSELRSVNGTLWNVEDALRVCERDSQFADEFIKLARSVYKLNDKRSGLKRDIDVLLGSALSEVKSYA